jgi:IS5 family transposase
VLVWTALVCLPPGGRSDRAESDGQRQTRQGIPLATLLTGANRHESQVLAELVDSIEPIKRPRGRPRKRPEKLHADKAYNSWNCRHQLRKRAITPRIARKGVDSSERLGRYRWVVERTGSWLNRFRRLKVRYERRADIHQAFLDLGCALICWRFVEKIGF